MPDEKDKVGSRDFLYDYLDPMQKYSVKKEVKPKDPIEEIVNKIFDDVEYSDFDDIKKMISNIGYSKQIEDLKDFHGIGPKGLLFEDDEYLKAKKVVDSSCMINAIKDDSGEVLAGKKLAVFSTRHPFITPAFRNTKEIDFFLNYMPSIFASQIVPYLDVEFQVNRDPVQWENRENSEDKGTINATRVTSPSTIRFLMGSADTAGLKGADAALELGRLVQGAGHSAAAGDPDKVEGGKSWLDKTTAFSGMEMFMMPQILTNFDELNESQTRMNAVKPFLPFASIEAFDITLANAGAGMLSHKAGVLRLKIHDKARLPEFSQFIRGSVGFATARIITTYGWRAPEGRGSDEIYSEFINKKMTVRDRWMITNTSFSFDVMGQVTLTLQISNAGITEIQGAEISENAYLQDAHARLADITKILKDFSDRLAQRASTSTDVSLVQVLQGAADRSFVGAAADPKVREAATKAKSIISKFGDKLGYSSPERHSAVHALDEFTNTTSTNIAVKLLAGVTKASVERFRGALSGVIDPFLPDIAANQNTNVGYFDENYIQLLKGTNPIDKSLVVLQRDTQMTNPPLSRELQKRLVAQQAQDAATAADNKRQEEQNKKEKVAGDTTHIQLARSDLGNVKAIALINNLEESMKPQKGVDDKLRLTGNDRNVASFGLIFTRFVAEAIFHKNTCQELQIFFYSLNNNCGPVSGQSIAEFPLDLDKLMSVYSKSLKASDVVTVEAFLAMIMQTQFTDNRHFAYGMSPAYNPWTPDPSDQLAKNEKNYDTFMLNYHMQYPNFTSPQIEMYVESGADLGKDLEISEQHRSVGGSKITKRLHVYDKTCNPRELLSNIIQTNDFVTLGATANGSAHQGSTVRTDRLRISLENKIKAMKMQMSKRSGVPVDQINDEPTIFASADGAYKVKKGSARDLLNIVSSMLPAIRPGTNGSLVTTATMASKTNSLATSGNMVQQLKGFTGGPGGALPPANGFEDPNNQPLRTYPAQLTMQTLGCPIANLYQQFYVDFGTGTTLDNLYYVTSIKHSLAPGQFKTDMTFVPNDAYGKLAGGAVIKATLQQVLNDIGKNERLQQWEAKWIADHPPPARPPQPPAAGPDIPVKDPPRKPGLTLYEANLISYFNKLTPPANYRNNSTNIINYISGPSLQDQWRTERYSWWATNANAYPGWNQDNLVAKEGDPVQWTPGAGGGRGPVVKPYEAPATNGDVVYKHPPPRA